MPLEHTLWAVPEAGVVSSRHSVSAHFLGESQEGIEFDVPVACKVRVRGQPTRTLCHKVGEDSRPVLGHEIRLVQGDAQVTAHRVSILQYETGL